MVLISMLIIGMVLVSGLSELCMLLIELLEIWVVIVVYKVVLLVLKCIFLFFISSGLVVVVEWFFSYIVVVIDRLDIVSM